MRNYFDCSYSPTLPNIGISHYTIIQNSGQAGPNIYINNGSSKQVCKHMKYTNTVLLDAQPAGFNS